MAANTKENRDQVASEIVEECKHNTAIKAYVVKVLSNTWNADDDSWNYASDELMGQIHGEPFGGEWELLDSDTAGLSWYELCVLNTAIRRMRTRERKGYKRYKDKWGEDVRETYLQCYETKLELLDSIAATLKRFEKRLKRHYGLDATEAYHTEESQKLRADKVVVLSISKGGE